MSERGTLFTLSAPSGAGKTSLVAALLKCCDGIQVSVSHTTRPRRSEEADGVNYHFVNDATFISMLDKGGFLEHARVFDYYYGTSAQWVDETLASGIDVILEIDWQGAAQVHRLEPECVRIFILPPSLDALSKRLTDRGQDNPKVIARRVAEAQEEMSHYVETDYLLVNDDFDMALKELNAIIIAQRTRLGTQQHRHLKLLQDILS